MWLLTKDESKIFHHKILKVGDVVVSPKLGFTSSDDCNGSNGIFVSVNPMSITLKINEIKNNHYRCNFTVNPIESDIWIPTIELSSRTKHEYITFVVCKWIPMVISKYTRILFGLKVDYYDI